MLHTQTIDEKTLVLLKKLQQADILHDFYLVGGTSLALRMGHRKSVDLDLFCQHDFDVEVLCKYLVETYDFKEAYRAQNTLKGFVDGVMIDCIKYDYPFVDNPVEEEGIRMLSLQDVCAMKLAAITDNGSRLKDYIDIAWLSRTYTLSDMLGFYQQKYRNSSVFSVVKAITYFDDINFGEDIVMMTGKFDWKTIETRLKAMTRMV